MLHLQETHLKCIIEQRHSRHHQRHASSNRSVSINNSSNSWLCVEWGGCGMWHVAENKIYNITAIMHLNNIISRHIKSLKSRQFFLSFISCLPSFIHFVAKRTQVYLAHGNLCFFSEFFLSQSAFSNMVTFFVRFFVHSLFLSVSSILHFSAVFSSISNRSFNLVRLTNDKCT